MGSGVLGDDTAQMWRKLYLDGRKPRPAVVPLAPAIQCFKVDAADMIGEEVAVYHPEVAARGIRAMTVYAVALIFQPRRGVRAAPLVILRQLIRTGERPITDKEAVTLAVAVEVENWKDSRPPVESFTVPSGVVCWRVIPAFA